LEKEPFLSAHSLEVQIEFLWTPEVENRSVTFPDRGIKEMDIGG
jgi:hypothetical protein